MLKQPYELFYRMEYINLTCIVTEYLELEWLTILVSESVIFIGNISVFDISVYLLIGAALSIVMQNPITFLWAFAQDSPLEVPGTNFELIVILLGVIIWNNSHCKTTRHTVLCIYAHYTESMKYNIWYFLSTYEADLYKLTCWLVWSDNCQSHNIVLHYIFLLMSVFWEMS